MSKSISIPSGLSIATGLGVGALWFIAERAIDPFHPMDVKFYLRLYLMIGGVSGCYAAYMASLVASDRIRFLGAALVLACPYSIIVVLTQDRRIGFVAIVLYGLTLLPTFIASK